MYGRRHLPLVALSLLLLAVLISGGCQSFGGGGPEPRTLPSPAPAPRDGSVGGWGSSALEGQTKGAAPRAPSESNTTASSVKTPPMVIRDKTLTMQVQSVRKTLSVLNVMTGKYGASITNTSISSQDGNVIMPEGTQQRRSSDSGPLSGTITIKIPATRFDAFTSQARKLGKIQAESESTEDVTQQAVDMKARLKNLRAEEAAFIRFFKAATTVQELIKIESQLSRVRGEIESLQAQLDLLETRVAMATLTLQVSEPSDIVSPSGIDWGVGTAFTQAIRNFVGVINFLIQMTGALLPLILLAAAGFWVVRWLLMRFVFKKPPAVGTESSDADE